MQRTQIKNNGGQHELLIYLHKIIHSNTIVFILKVAKKKNHKTNDFHSFFCGFRVDKWCRCLTHAKWSYQRGLLIFLVRRRQQHIGATRRLLLGCYRPMVDAGSGGRTAVLGIVIRGNRDRGPVTAAKTRKPVDVAQTLCQYCEQRILHIVSSSLLLAQDEGIEANTRFKARRYRVRARRVVLVWHPQDNDTGVGACLAHRG